MNVKPQRINQLLDEGKLEGPAYPRPKAPKNAPRVWKSSLDGELARRRQSPAMKHPRAPRLRGPGTAWLDRREARVQAVAQQLKVIADISRQELREERKANRRVRAKLLRIMRQHQDVMEELMSRLEVESERAEQALDRYSDVLTQLLGPDDIGPIGPQS